MRRIVTSTRSAWYLREAAGKDGHLAQRSIEMLIGRLLTHERFRTEFLAAPAATLHDLCALGLELTAAEISGLVSTNPAL
jgi:hypothetical protein